MSDLKFIGIDATGCFCPEFTAPVLSLIRPHLTSERQIIIKTREPRARQRIQHMCAQMEWSIEGYDKNDDTEEELFLLSLKP